MTKKTAPRSSRLVPQRPAPKPRLFSPRPKSKTRILPRGRPQNSYRRNRFKGESRKNWLRGLACCFGLLALAGLCLGLVVLYHQLLTCNLFCIKDIKQYRNRGGQTSVP